ncbi:hypothetical protein H5410_028784 [Solanum commersonii]|uniref:Uncharacterized protein n=1 Tax=Solanum commersonii TaxID=4109 RepID=A0A9J5Z749_SOLCO|nr:hypothetical protein H5410_028784 [Solanum commersonii]
MVDFFIQDLELVDPPQNGGEFTWSRGKSHIASKIDKFLFSTNSSRTYFKFENMWVEHEGIINVRGSTGKTSWNEKHEKNSQRQNPELVQKAYLIMDIEGITMRKLLGDRNSGSFG